MRAVISARCVLASRGRADARSYHWFARSPEAAAAGENKPRKAVAIISYDEKPGIQAIATTAPDLPPEPGMHATFAVGSNMDATAR